MIENIKQFFQDMYDATIGKFLDWISALYLWISQSWDLLLYIGAFLLGLLLLYVLMKLLVPLRVLLSLFLEGLFLLFFVGFFLWFGSVLVDMYNQIVAISGMLNTSSDLGCFGHILDCLTVRGILSFYFTQLFIVISLILLLRAYNLAIFGQVSLLNALHRLGIK